MPFDLVTTKDHSNGQHDFRVCAFKEHAICMRDLANEYRNLRTQCALPLNKVSVEGIGVVDTSRISSILAEKTVPSLGTGPLDIVRSDMGETIAYVVLEKLYSTKIGYKGVRDRELIQLPGRGIDAVGVEENGTLTLVLGEAKVSGESKNPPQVVDAKDDSISNSLIRHIQEHQETSCKVWDVIRHTRDEVVQDLLIRAALYWDSRMWHLLSVVCCGILVRPLDKYGEEDFGALRKNPGLVDPAKVRFVIVCIDNDLDKTVQEFHGLATTTIIKESGSNGQST